MKNSISGFQSEVVDDQLLPTLTRHARESRWKNLLSLYMQLMAHFEIKLAAPTVEFKVPLLNLIADKDTGAETEKAIVQMNALVLGHMFIFQKGWHNFENSQKRMRTDSVLTWKMLVLITQCLCGRTLTLSMCIHLLSIHYSTSGTGMSNTIISAFTTTSKARHSRRISTQIKICCKILNKSCIFSKQICQKP
jgi:hypothetical protein